MKRFKELKEQLEIVATDNLGKSVPREKINKLQGAIMKRDNEGTRRDESVELDEGPQEIKQHIEHQLAQQDINAMVHQDRVHVHPDNLKKAKTIVKKLGYRHDVVGTLGDSTELEGEQLDERGLDVGHNQRMVKKNFDKYVQAVRHGKYRTASRVSRKYFKNKTKLMSAGKTPVK